MRTKNLFHLLCFSLLAEIVASGCSSDGAEYPGPAPQAVNAAYFSGGSASGNNLNLLYSGTEWAGKEARFQTSDGEKATLTLKNIVPGETLTSFEVSLLPSTDAYAFSGTTSTATGCSLTYDGTVRSSLMSLNIQLAQPSHPLDGTWNPVPFDRDPSTEAINSAPLRVTWEASGESATAAAQLSVSLSTEGSLYVQQFLQSISFLSDGNITASYRKNLPDAGWVQSPLNLCPFYVKGGKLYLSPDIRMITALVQQNKAEQAAALQTSTVQAGSLAVSTQSTTRSLSNLEIISLLAQVLQWGQEGIPFQIRQNENGTVSVFLEQSTIAPILPLLPLLADYLSLDEATAAKVHMMIELITTVLPQTTRLEIGIDLSK